MFMSQLCVVGYAKDNFLWVLILAAITASEKHLDMYFNGSTNKLTAEWKLEPLCHTCIYKN